jgi:hypothetical protein
VCEESDGQAELPKLEVALKLGVGCPWESSGKRSGDLGVQPSSDLFLLDLWDYHPNVAQGPSTEEKYIPSRLAEREHSIAVFLWGKLEGATVMHNAPTVLEAAT